MLNTMMENKHKSFISISIFSEIMVADHGIYDHDLRKEIKIMVYFFRFPFCF